MVCVLVVLACDLVLATNFGVCGYCLFVLMLGFYCLLFFCFGGGLVVWLFVWWMSQSCCVICLGLLWVIGLFGLVGLLLGYLFALFVWCGVAEVDLCCLVCC